jgi:hypothetical protein
MRDKKKESKDFVSPRQELRESKRLTLKELIGGGVLSRESVVRQIPFVLFLFVLLVFYIGNQYQGARVMKKVIQVESRLKVLKTESITTTFERMEMSKQSEVVRMIEEKGLPLKQAVLPPYNIKID